MTLHQFFAILYARKWIIVIAMAVVLTVAVVVSALMPQKWTARASVLVDSKGSDPVTGLILPGLITPGYMATQVDIIQSQNVALKVVRGLKLAESPAIQEQWRDATDGRGSSEIWLAELLLKNLDVKPSRESNVLDIGFSGADPRFAAAIANAFAQAYVDTSLELKVEPARQTAKWFSERTRTLRQDLEGSAAKLAEYQREKGIVSLDERLETENARLEQLNSQLSQGAALTADAQTRQRLAREFTAKGGAPDGLPDILSNPLITSLKTTLSAQEGRLQELASRLGAGHPQYQAAAAELESGRQKLREEMRAVIAGIENNAQIAQRREAEIRNQVAAQKDRVLKLKRERDELAVLMREAESAQKAFDATMQRFNQTSLESQATQTNLAILDAASEPLMPSSPNWRRNMAVGLFLGTLLGIGLALLLEFLDQRIRSEADILASLQVPVFATIPVARRPVIARARLAFLKRTPAAQ